MQFVASAPVPEAPRGPDGWTQLVREIEGCQRCPLGRTRTHVVIYRGSARPRLVFLGEAPGKAEDEQGRPFVGRSGRRLDAAIERLRLGSDVFGILNVVKCRPPGNKLPSEAVTQCRPYLERQLGLLKPRLIVTLGAHALSAMDPDSPPISQVAGRIRRGMFGPVFPLLHPAATFRSGRFATRWDEDIGRLGELLRDSELETL